MKSVKKVSILLAIILSLLYKSSFAQPSFSDPKSPSSSTTAALSGSDFSWSDADDTYTSNNQYAVGGATLTLLNPSKYSNYIKLTNFNMSIPTAVTISGIVVQLERKASGLSLAAVVKDYAVRIVKGNTITGDNKASGSGWSGSEATATYGSSSDLWGTTWTATDINSGNFGVAFSAEISGLLGVFLSADIDNVTITVYYEHIILPVSIAGFHGAQKGNAVELVWETKQENNISKFVVERQLNHSTWEVIQEIDEVKNELQKKTFRAYDFQPKSTNSYRLKLIDKNNNISYSEITNVRLNQTSDDLLIEINRSNKAITLLATEPIISCKIFRTDGVLISSTQNTVSKNILTIPLNSLPEGNLIVIAETRRKRIARQINTRQ